MRFVIFSSGLKLNLDGVFYIGSLAGSGESNQFFPPPYTVVRSVGADSIALTAEQAEELERYISDFGIGDGFTKLT